MTAPKKNKGHSLSIGALNFHGLLEKLDDSGVINLIRQDDIFGASEIWLKEKVKISLVPGYNFYPVNRNVDKGPTKVFL